MRYHEFLAGLHRRSDLGGFPEILGAPTSTNLQQQWGLHSCCVCGPILFSKRTCFQVQPATKLSAHKSCEVGILPLKKGETQNNHKDTCLQGILCGCFCMCVLRSLEQSSMLCGNYLGSDDSSI